MRTKIGKRIGPVPIAYWWQCLALATFISAGLLALNARQPAQAQIATGTLPDRGVDVGEAASLVPSILDSLFTAI